MITIVSFSGRPNGNSMGVANVMKECLKDKEVQVVDFSEMSVEPCNHCSCDCFLPDGECPVKDDVGGIYEKIMQSEEVYFIVANYCGYPNAKFFAFNERSSSFFKRSQELLEQYLAVPKKFVVISNSNMDKFKELMQYQVSEGAEPQMLFLSSSEFNVSSFAGNLMEVPEAREKVAEFCVYKEK